MLSDHSIELSVVWCAERDEAPETEVGRWLAEQRDDILYDKAGGPETAGPRVALTRLFMEAMLLAIREHAPGSLLREERG